MRSFRAEEEESEEQNQSVETMEADLRRLAREARYKHELLQSRAGATLSAGKVALPLEELAKQHGLLEFEKLVIALALGPNLDNGFRRIIEAATGTSNMQVGVALDILCENLEEKIRVRRLFVNTGNLLGKGLLNLACNRSIDSEDDFMNAVLIAMHRAMQLPDADQRITQADLRAGAAIQRRSRLEYATDKVIPQFGLADVILSADTRRQIEEIIFAARKRSTVFAAWGFGQKMSAC